MDIGRRTLHPRLDFRGRALNIKLDAPTRRGRSCGSEGWAAAVAAVRPRERRAEARQGRDASARTRSSSIWRTPSPTSRRSAHGPRRAPAIPDLRARPRRRRPRQRHRVRPAGRRRRGDRRRGRRRDHGPEGRVGRHARAPRRPHRPGRAGGRHRAGDVRVLVLLETARGIADCDAILAAAPDRVHTVVFGAGDFSVQLGIDLTPDATELAYARSRLVVAARAAGLAAPVDGPWLRLRTTRASRPTAGARAGSASRAA